MKNYSKIISLVLGLFLLFYLIWEIYWYNQVGLQFIRWHTHLFFVFLIYLFTLSIIKLFRASKKIVFIHFLVFAGLFACETVFILTGFNKTPTEKIYGFYSDGYSDSKQRYYWIDKPHTTKILQTEEFYFERHTNSLGYSDYEWEKEKDSNEYRILCLGDSFTEGDGAHVDSSYVAHLRRLFQKNYPNENISIFNAGKCGSDPFYNFINYLDILSNYNPDLIVQTLSVSDIYWDIFSRGGMERFGENYTLDPRLEPKINKFIFAVNYTSRIIYNLLGYNENLVQTKSFFKNKDEYLQMTFSLIKRFRDESLKNDCELILTILPGKDDVIMKYPIAFTQLIHKIKNEKIEILDLRESYLKYFGNKLDVQINRYYWSKDPHHNALGYELMAKGVFHKISTTINFEN